VYNKAQEVAKDYGNTSYFATFFSCEKNDREGHVYMVKKSQKRPGEPQPAPLRGKKLVVWRVVWSLIALFDLGILVFSMPGFIAQQRSVCTDLTRVNCGLYQLIPAQMVVLNRFGFSLDGYAAYVLILDAVITLALFLVGALIFWHKSNDRMGLFVSLLLITFASLGVDEVHINDAVLPLPLLIFGYLVLFLQWPALGFFFYLFPDGRFVPRWSWLLGFLFVVQVGSILHPILMISHIGLRWPNSWIYWSSMGARWEHKCIVILR